MMTTNQKLRRLGQKRQELSRYMDQPEQEDSEEDSEQDECEDGPNN